MHTCVGAVDHKLAPMDRPRLSAMSRFVGLQVQVPPGVVLLGLWGGDRLPHPSPASGGHQPSKIRPRCAYSKEPARACGTYRFVASLARVISTAPAGFTSPFPTTPNAPFNDLNVFGQSSYCPRREVSCDLGCGSALMKLDMKGHVKHHCPHRMVQCRIKGCKVSPR